MKITSVVILDEGKGIFFAYVKQFPGICAQAKSIEEVRKKLNQYFKSFAERMSKQDVELDENSIETL